MKPETLETVTAYASKAQYGGAATAFFGGLTVNDLAMWVGIIVAVAGYFTNLYYRKKQDHRDEEKAQRSEREHQARMRMIERGDLAEPEDTR